jgi:phosphoglycerol transferase
MMGIDASAVRPSQFLSELRKKLLRHAAFLGIVHGPKLRVSNPLLRSAAAYAATITLSIVILVWVTRLWQADIAIPFRYDRDALFLQANVKTLIDGPWYLRDDRLGMPGGLEMNDFPLAETLHFLVLKLIAFFTSDPGAVINCYFLLTFPLTALTALFVLRRFSVSYGPSMVVSLLFTFLPYHFYRGCGHLFLAAYYLVPLMTMVVLWLYLGRLSGGPSHWRDATAPRHALIRRMASSLAICVVVASAGVYYAFFGCYLLLVAGVARSFRLRTMRPLWPCAILVTTMVLGIVANTAPTVWYRWRHGANDGIARRVTGESETFGLKIVQLFMPIAGHRMKFLAALADKYLDPVERVPLINENSWSSLGVTGSVGATILLTQCVLAPRKRRCGATLGALGILTITSILLGTVGAGGTAFALVISPMIRAYNRISIYIGFFALFAVALLLHRLGRRCEHLRLPQLLRTALLFGVLLVGVLDQTTSGFAPRYDALRQQFDEDAQFVKRIESCVPSGSMIFQLPQLGFPENGPLNRMSDYAHFRCFLHSKTLRWSYGAMKGRAWGQWQEWAAGLCAEEQVRTLSREGFSGIVLDRDGFEDNGDFVIAQMSRILGDPMVQSSNGQRLFFSMVRYNTSVSLTPQMELGSEHKEPIFVAWFDGFYPIERSGSSSWRWCQGRGRISIRNPLPGTRTVKLEMQVVASLQGSLRIAGPLLNDLWVISEKPTNVSRIVSLTPGWHDLTFECDAPRPDSGPDKRSLIFRVIDLVIHDVDEAESSAVTQCGRTGIYSSITQQSEAE